MPNLPNGWHIRKLGEIADVASGNGAPQESQYFEEGKIPFVRVQDLGRYGRNPNLIQTKDHVNEAAIRTKRLKIFPKGTILFPKSGVSTLLNHRAILGVDACVVGHLATVKARENIVLIKWLYYYLCTVDFSEMVSTTTLPSLQLSKISRLEVPVPSIKTQLRIISSLERSDNLIKLRQEANQLTNNIIQSVFLKMFGAPISNPKHWPETSLGEVLTENPENGLFKKKEFYGRGVPIVWVESLFDRNILELEGLRLIDANKKEIEKYRLKYGDMLLCRSSLLVEGVGKMVVVEDAQDTLLFESHVMRLRVDTRKLLPHYVVGFYNSEPGRNLVLEKARIATMTTINQPDVESLKIFLPPLELQHKFVEVLHKTHSLVQYQKESTQEINELFHSLVQRAFTGRLVS
jgi:type I restriction enzyme S subunit